MWTRFYKKKRQCRRVLHAKGERIYRFVQELERKIGLIDYMGILLIILYQFPSRHFA